jgi:hypothetical protein
MIVMMLAGQCSDDPTNPEESVYPDSGLSFSQHIHPIFIENCAARNGCHTSVNPANGLDLETPAPTFNSINGPVVIPFDAQASRLYLLLIGEYQGISRMPLNSAPLSDNKIRAIRIWINEGALTSN